MTRSRWFIIIFGLVNIGVIIFDMVDVVHGYIRVFRMVALAGFDALAVIVTLLVWLKQSRKRKNIVGEHKNN